MINQDLEPNQLLKLHLESEPKQEPDHSLRSLSLVIIKWLGHTAYENIIEADWYN